MTRKEYANRNVTVEMVADSVNPEGKRIMSMLWTYPRFIHAEIMTHRALSRNAASSRAIPVKKVIEAVRENPARPEWWGKAQGGMQADDRFEPGSDEEARLLDEWEFMRELTIGGGEYVAVPVGLLRQASGAADMEMPLWQLMEELHKCRPILGVQGLMEMGLHKQIANRPLEPWFHITVLVTATEWDNFYGLRAHKDAQPEFQVLAYRALDTMLRSTPNALDWGEWHIPFDPGTDSFTLQDRLVVGTAKAARTSYVAFDADKSLLEQKNLHDMMSSQGHWSPFEHPAVAAEGVVASGNFRGGWVQYRHTFPDQERKVEDYHELLAQKPDWITL